MAARRKRGVLDLEHRCARTGIDPFSRYRMFKRNSDHRMAIVEERKRVTPSTRIPRLHSTADPQPFAKAKPDHESTRATFTKFRPL
jgi:hypothetical protein